MDTETLTQVLQDLLDEAELTVWTDDVEVESTSSFAEAGVMTNNSGLVVRLADGSEFQVTVVRSR